MDLFIVSDGLLALSVVSIKYCRNHGTAKPFFILVIVAFVVALLQMCVGKAAVKNKSKKTISAKAEEDIEVSGEEEKQTHIVQVGSGEKIEGIDGVKSDGQVYKVVDGVHVTINERGKVFPSTLMGMLANKVGNGGYKRLEDFKEGYERRHWKVLFDAE